MSITLRRLTLGVAIASLSAAGACSKDAPATASTSAAAPVSNDSKPARRLAACELVTAAEMSAIFGKAMSAEKVDYDSCTYTPAEGSMPHVELKIESGMADAQAIAAGLLNRVEQGMASRFEGIGDSANAIGPMLHIRRGEDLISLMIFGGNDMASDAKRIYAILSPRLPPVDPAAAARSAASRAEATQAVADAIGTFAPAGSDLGGAADFIKALGALSGDASAKGLPADPRSTVGGAKSPAAVVALGNAEHIPLVQGLTITGSISGEEGDYEPIMQVTATRPESYDLVASADVPGLGRDRPVSVLRRVRNEDQRGARTMRDWFGEDDDEEYPGTTPYFSSAMIEDLRSQGTTAFTLVDSNTALYKLGAMRTLTGTLTRVERETVGVDVLVNGRLTKLPTIHARGLLSDRATTTNQMELWVLDDRVNPLVLRWKSERGQSRVVKIDFPEATRAAEIERALEKGETVEVYGIYFDFGSAAIRPQSAPVLEEIASIMRRHADWSLDLAGFTDSIGNDAANLDLSRRRTAAVKTELGARYGISADRLNSTGYGEGSPKATNDTPEGRAQNRRVEITRRRAS